MFSDTCMIRVKDGVNSKEFSVATSNEKFIHVSAKKFPTHQHILPTVPSDFSHRISKIHSNPPLWWYSQLIKYILRPKPKLKVHLAKEHHKIFQDLPKEITSYAGIHIRKGDKVTKHEALSYNKSKYMERVYQYFLLHDPGIQIVYLASDDADDLKNTRKEYKDLLFKGPVKPPGRKMCGDDYLGIVTDVFMLAKSNFTILTLSSNVGRLVYELMQALHYDDMSNQVISLDAPWKVHRSKRPKLFAIEKHKAQVDTEIDLEIGDIVEMGSTRLPRASYSFGHNVRTGKQGYYPSYKVENILVTAKFWK